MTTDTAVGAAAPRAASDLRTAPRRPAWLVVFLCWLIVVLDGYDLIVYGTTLPAIMKEPGWGLTASTAGFIGSLAFFGMMLGALGAGDIADRFGRRGTIIVASIWFSLFTALCWIAPNREIFGLFRFLGGVGLGGLVPSANALTAEFVKPKYRSAVSTFMMSGVPIGGVSAALIGLWVLPDHGWRPMYLIAALGIALAALCWFVLPESAVWLRHHGKHEQAREVEQVYGLESGEFEHHPANETPIEAAAEQTSPRPSGLAALMGPKYRLATLVYALATIATLFAWYGLGTWLPKLMASDHRFDMGNPLNFLLALNIGAVLGSIITAWAGVRFGPLRSAVVAALLAAAGLAYLLTFPSSVAPIYAALILAGVGTHGTQCLIIAAVASHYPPELRGSALGSALGFGRLGAVLAPQVGGWLLAANLGVGSNFLAFSLAAALAAVLLVVTMVATKPASEKAVMDSLAH